MSIEICLETREDLVTFLKSTSYDYVILKFHASWCKPCKKLKPFVDKTVNETIERLDSKKRQNAFIFIEVDIDVCTDLYAFLKQKKRINGVPSIFLYDMKAVKKQDTEYYYIPTMSVSGIDYSYIQKIFDYIQ